MSVIVNKRDDLVVSKFYKIVIWLIALIFSFATGQEVPYNPKFSQDLNKFFYSSFITERFFSIFELLVIILALGMIIQFKPLFRKGEHDGKVLFILSIIYFFFLIFNPNNEAVSNIYGIPLSVLKKYGVYFLTLFAFLFTSTTYSRVVIKELGYSLIVLLSIKAFISLVSWVSGMGADFFHGVTSSMTEEDLLIHLVFVQMLALVLYLDKKKNIFLLIWVTIFLVEFLSWRRSGFMLMLLGNGILYSVNFLYSSSITERFRLFWKFFISASIFITIIASGIIDVPINHYLQRYFGFLYLGYVPDYVSNEHIEQANYGFQQITQNFFFWGNGVGNINAIHFLNWKGNTGIHNAYVESWLQQGFYAFIYFCFLFFLALKYFVLTLREIINKKNILLKLAVSAFLFLFFVNAWILIDQNFQQSNMLFIRVVLFSILINYKINDYKYLLKR